jgi:hypothetical protein
MDLIEVADRIRRANEGTLTAVPVGGLRGWLEGLWAKRAGGWRRSTGFSAVGRYLFGKKVEVGIWPPRIPGDHSFGHLFDHPSFWRHPDGRYAVAAHLYDLDDEKRDEIEELCERFGLQAEYPDFPSWWYPGQTTFVWWQKKLEGNPTDTRRVGGR